MAVVFDLFEHAAEVGGKVSRPVVVGDFREACKGKVHEVLFRGGPSRDGVDAGENFGFCGWGVFGEEDVGEGEHAAGAEDSAGFAEDCQIVGGMADGFLAPGEVEARGPGWREFFEGTCPSSQLIIEAECCGGAFVFAVVVLAEIDAGEVRIGGSGEEVGRAAGARAEVEDFCGSVVLKIAERMFEQSAGGGFGGLAHEG